MSSLAGKFGKAMVTFMVEDIEPFPLHKALKFFLECIAS